MKELITCASIFTEAMENYPAGNYMFKVNNRNTRARCEICSKLTIKTPVGLYFPTFGLNTEMYRQRLHKSTEWLMASA